MSNSKLLSNLILTTVIIVVAFSIFQYKNYMGSSTIEFTDENSEKSVRMTIHKPKGHILKKDLEKINEIQANFGNPLVILNGNITYKMTDLDGIQYFKHLEILSLSGHNINDLSPLSSLSNLQLVVNNIKSKANKKTINEITLICNLNKFNGPTFGSLTINSNSLIFTPFKPNLKNEKIKIDNIYTPNIHMSVVDSRTSGINKLLFKGNLYCLKFKFDEKGLSYKCLMIIQIKH